MKEEVECDPVCQVGEAKLVALVQKGRRLLADLLVDSEEWDDRGDVVFDKGGVVRLGKIEVFLPVTILAPSLMQVLSAVEEWLWAELDGLVVHKELLVDLVSDVAWKLEKGELLLLGEVLSRVR